MDKKTKTLSMMYAIFAVALVVSNCIASKLFPVFGGVITVGVIVYPITFLMTDIIGQRYGKREAQWAVVIGFVAQILALVVTLIGGRMADANGVQEAYMTMFGSNWVMVLGSLAAYLISQSVDVQIFHRIKDAYEKNHPIGKNRWIWNNVSTMTSQLVDSAVYAGIVYTFAFHMPWFADAANGVTFGSTIICSILIQWAFKSILALCDTPIFYLFTRKVEREEDRAC